MLYGIGYLTRSGGAVFQTRMHIVTECDESVAEPGELVHIEGDTIKNLSRIGSGRQSGTVFPLKGSAWLATPVLSLC